MTKRFEVTITETSNGHVVECGDQSFIAPTRREISRAVLKVIGIYKTGVTKAEKAAAKAEKADAPADTAEPTVEGAETSASAAPAARVRREVAEG